MRAGTKPENNVGFFDSLKNKLTEISHVETYNTTTLSCERAPRLHADGTWDVAKCVIEFK